ncbi:MAG: DUF1513 domain-containing protein [Nitratireductor sp.]|nr:DUF1513 domain-containing protein [Nitratireductor sp.]
MAIEIDRRAFLAAAGAAFLTGLPAAGGEALAGSRALFATAFMDEAKAYGFAIVTERGEIVHREAMPGRAHGLAWSAEAGRAVAFARRPGNFAIGFDPAGRRAPIAFHAPDARHFYGHGVFSRDGGLLYAAENDLDAGIGKIGIYDAADGFRRLGEFDSFGVGPHEIILMRDGRTLAVANGGIRTHPDFGRAKLNLAEMKSTIALIDGETGSLIADFRLPADYRRMSLRHMVHAGDGSLWIGGQFEGDVFAPVSPVIRLDPDGALAPIELARPARSLLAGYVGAVALSADGGQAGFSSPKGGGYIVIDTMTKRLLGRTALARNSGLAAAGQAMIASSEFGRIGECQYPLYWDNHICAIG